MSHSIPKLPLVFRVAVATAVAAALAPSAALSMNLPIEGGAPASLVRGQHVVHAPARATKPAVTSRPRGGVLGAIVD
jgi:hypothetical protein